MQEIKIGVNQASGGDITKERSGQGEVDAGRVGIDASRAAGDIDVVGGVRWAVGGVQENPVEMEPIRVLVIDDELAGMDRSHLEQLDPGAGDLLGDPDSPEAQEILAISKDLIDTESFEDTNEFARFLSSNDFVQRVLTTETFRNKASPTLRDNFANFLARCERVVALRAEFVAAFHEPRFDMEFVASRPTPARTLTYQVIFVDLVLKGSATPVDDLQNYLKSISNEAGDSPLPPIVAMSSAETELHTHRREFSEKAQISAAGLWILPKADLEAADFKARGLQVLFDQLMRQRSAAYRMRSFILSWTKALKKAGECAATTLWNLDAAAVQRLHHTAIKDNDPFDGYFGELISREYLWHVESDAQVGSTMAALDACLREHIDARDQIANRFMAPVVDPGVTRSLFSHFTWVGWPSTGCLNGVQADQLVQRFNVILPYGSVLVNELTEGSECLVHITQQCDLNAASRPEPEERSAVFATAIAHEAPPHHLVQFHTQDLVARGLKDAGREFDLKFVPGRTVAMRIADFLARAEQQKLRIVGRLRYDVAGQFVQATANQLTRPASLVMAREASFQAKAFLVGHQFAQQQPTVYPGADGKGRVVNVARDGLLLSFQDDDGVRIAIWIERMLTNNCGRAELDVGALSNQLRLGVKHGQQLVENVTLELHHGELKTAFKTVKGINPEPAPAVKLVLVADPSTKV